MHMEVALKDSQKPFDNPLTKLAEDTVKTSKLEIIKSASERIAEMKDFSASPFIQLFHYMDVNRIDIDLMTALHPDMNLTNLLPLEIDYRVKTRQNMNWSVFGHPGSGKTLFGMSLYLQICAITGVPFKLKNIFTNGTLLLERIYTLFDTQYTKKDLVENDVIMADERLGDRTGLGAVREMMATTDAEQRIRYMMIHFIWCSVILSEHQHTAIFETFDTERAGADENYNVKRIRCLVYDSKRMLRGHIILSAPPEEIIAAYKKMVKERGLKDFFSEAVDPRMSLLKRIANILKNDPEYQDCVNNEQRVDYITSHWGYRKFTVSELKHIIGLAKPKKSERSQPESLEEESDLMDMYNDDDLPEFTVQREDSS